MHHCLRGARVHAGHAALQRGQFFRAHQVGLADQDLVGKANLALRFQARIELLVGVFGIDQGDDRVQQVLLGHRVVHEEGLRHGAGVGQPGGFDYHAVKMQCACAFFLSQRGDLDEIRRIVFRLMDKDAPLEAIQYLQKINQPVARMYQAALLYYGKERAQIEASLRDAGELEIKKMERGLGLLDVIITAAPLLGLLGTVTGIIDSFNILAVAQGLPSATELSRGIAEALITTAFGLMIAIPSLFLMHWLNRMIDKNLTNMNQMSKEFLENYGNRGEQS